MPRCREQWVKYHLRPDKGEVQLGYAGTLLWPVLLRAAHEFDGEIPLAEGLAPGRHLARVLGTHGETDRRLVAAGTAELLAAGLLALRGGHLAVSAWASRRPHRPHVVGSMPQPSGRPGSWIPLLIEQGPAFAALTVGARGLLANLLRACGEDGRFLVEPRDVARSLWLDVTWQSPGRWLLRHGLLASWLAELRGGGRIADLPEGIGGRPAAAICGFDRGRQTVPFTDEAAAAPAGSGVARPWRDSLASAENHSGQAGTSLRRDPGATLARPWRDPGATLARPWRDSLASAENHSITRGLIGSEEIRSDPPLDPPPRTGGEVALAARMAGGVPEPEAARPAAPSPPGAADLVAPSPDGAATMAQTPLSLTLVPQARRSWPAEGSSPSRAAQARVRRLRRRSGDEPAEYPPEFEAMWAPYPGRHGLKGSKLEALIEAERSAAGMPGGLAELRDRVLAALAWQVRLGEWRRPDPPVPDFARYLARRRWEDQRPTDPLAFEVPAARGGRPGALDPAAEAERRRRDKERLEREQRRIDAQIAEDEKVPTLEEEIAGEFERLEALWRAGKSQDTPLPRLSQHEMLLWNRHMTREFLLEIAKRHGSLEATPRWFREWRAANPPAPAAPAANDPPKPARPAPPPPSLPPPQGTGGGPGRGPATIAQLMPEYLARRGLGGGRSA